MQTLAPFYSDATELALNAASALIVAEREDRRSEHQLVCPIFKHQSLDELHAALRGCERRLGTQEETPGDFDLARCLAHEINNRVQLRFLHSAMRELGQAVTGTEAGLLAQSA